MKPSEIIRKWEKAAIQRLANPPKDNCITCNCSLIGKGRVRAGRKSYCLTCHGKRILDKEGKPIA